MPKVTFAHKFHPMQQEIVDTLDGKILNKLGTKYRFCVAAIGRQWGKSLMAKLVVLDHAINKNHVVMWVAPTIPTARSHWNDLVSLIQKSGIPYKRISQASKEIMFHGGGYISVRSAVEPDSLRGATLDLCVLDEAAFFRNGEYVYYSIIVPMITASRGSILVLSTPNGRNWFWKLWKEGQDGTSNYVKSWRATSYDSPFQDKDLLDQLVRTTPEYKFREEYLAEFLADSGGVFAGAEKAAVVKRITAPEQGQIYVAGIDWGFNHDATCFTVINKITREQVFGERFFGRGTLASVKKIIELMHIWQPETTFLERNGLGMPLFNLLQSGLRGNPLTEDEMTNADVEPETEVNNDHVFITSWNGKVRGLFMNNDMKRMLVETLSTDIEYGRLKILEEADAYGEIQLSEFSTYQRERVGEGFLIKYGAQEGTYDDTVSCLYLANKGLPRPKPTKVDISGKTNKEKIRNPFKSTGRVKAHRKGRKNAISS